MTKRRGKGGFTLVELAVTLVILSILFAIAVPNLLGYIHLSQFRRNESCAKTMYLSAESALTYCRTGGEWESFCRRVKDEGVLNRSFDEADGEQKKLSGRIYGIRLDADEYASGELSGDGSLVDELLSQDTYDKSLLNAAICIEIDVESGHVYSVFYGTNCKGLYYGSNALSQPAELSGEWLDMDSRASYDLRRAERLGYYSVQDAVNVVNLDAAKLKITSINLVNGETLSLGWSSSVRAQNRANVYYEVKLYSSADKARLLTIRVPGSALKTGAQPLEVTAEDGTRKNYTFPIEYDQTAGRASLVLDGMMNAQLYSRLGELSDEDEAAFLQSSSTSITRFGGRLAAPVEVYATVQAFPDPNAAYDSGEMYQKSDVIDSNRANTLFGDGTNADGDECEVKAFRHLSNIRYTDTAAEFSVAARSLDWTSDSVRVYGTAAHGALTVSSGTDIGFPSIPELRAGQTLNGAGGLLNRIAAVFTGGNAVSSLRLDDTSIDANAEYLGLFQKNSGTIRGLRLLSPQVDVTSGTLKGVGAVCGYSCGSLEGDSVDGEDASVRAALTAANAEGIGGVAGVIEGNGRITGLSASGAVTGTLPVSGKARGIGGIAGSLSVSGTAVKDLTSRAFVTGNRSAGGIAGYLAGSGQPTRQDLLDCTNEGLVLSSADADKTSLAGRYIGGIVGYAYHASLGGCTSRAGRAADYEYTQADRSRLRGRYVGGIVGYCDSSVLYRCSTGADGYVLGSEYVGGIIGGANEGADSLLLHDGTPRVTSNASCVIGNSYVGGIIGRNSGGSAIENCVNTGVAAGYQAYIGGICGANEKNASIVNCASYVSDTDGAVYRRVTGWGATGSYAGGLTGYNSGRIVFDRTTSAVSTRSVAGIVVGRDYVGGLVGYNDADGTIDVDYTLIGGSVFASGDCAGGLAGLNASTSLLGQTLTVKPASVQGRYYVGGAIGANVVDPDTDITVGSLRVDNSLGSVTAEAFCGGLIGYQRTYTEKDRAGKALYALLPGIAENGDNVPGAVTPSTNPHTVTITANANSAGRLSVVSNNMTIRAYAYAGGIVGCGEPQSRMQVVGCLNAGGFDRPADGVFPDSRLKTGVNLAAYLRTQGHENAAQALSDEPGADALRVSFVGGIVGVNGENHVIDRCASRGTMNGLDAMGGVAGLNEGLITDCTLSGSMGSATQDYIGGIAGLNVGGSTAGTIENCTAGKNCTVTGRATVGGIVGYNLSGGRVQGCTGSANVSGAGRVGGIAGENGGEIVLSGATAGARRVTGTGSGVGGVIGVNTAFGTLRAADGSAQGDVIAADSGLTVRGGSKVGGIAGINRGTLGGVSGSCLTSQAASVRAESGLAGGIAGAQEGAAACLRFAKNLGRVTANTGAAGGIVGISSAGSTVENCIGDGSVASSDGYAGGIAGENLGRIEDCAVGSGGAAVTLTTRSRTAAGAVCAVNHSTGTVSGAEIGDRVTISGSAFLLGALVGDNSGTVADAEVAQQPEYDVSATSLQVGGAVGINRPGGTVRSVRVTSDFEGFSRYQYLGGVVGQNCAPSSDGTAAGKVENCTYSGAITEGKSAAANCYGGIAGVNGGLLSGNTVSALTLTADGVYTATATSSAADKERLSTHIGGIAGKNDTTGIIEQCYIDNSASGAITVKNGMVGGVTGYNKGAVTLSGDRSTETLMAGVREVSDLLANAKDLSADSSWVKWQDGTDIEKLTYASSGKPVAQGRTMQIIVTGNGSLGGIAGCNAPSGALDRCVSGDWLLVNRSDSISVGTGGIIGMNESENDLSFLLNRAFVGRQLRSAQTNRFAGGIIGTQTNRTTSDWLIEGCINYGTVYGCLSHYSGGIIGQWTNNGGTLERCYNYGNLQTTFQANWVGASGGIVAQLYHAASGQDFNILSCQNHGSLYGRDGQSVADCANDSGGILGNVTAYAADAGKGQAFTINVVDCVNGPGVEIYSGSMASGIVGFFSTDGVANITDNRRAQQLITNATENITLNIDRCRNYAQTLNGFNFTAGIFGDRYAYGRTQPATDTYIQNCFSVTPGQKDREIICMDSGGSDTLGAEKTGNNYYFDDAWGITNQYASGGIDSDYKNRRESRRAYSRMLGYGLFRQRLFAAVAGPTLTPVDSFATTAHGMYYNMTPSNTSIDGHGIMTETSSGKIVGRVIYDMPYSYEPYVFNHGGERLQQAVKTRNGGASGMDAYARTAYREFEHGKTDTGALDGSFGVSLRQNSEGGFEVSITDDDRPLYYEGRVSVDGKEVLSGLRFVPNQKGQGLWDPDLDGTQAYGAGTTEGTFQLPADLETDTAGRKITLSVRAVSLFEDTAPSAWKQAQTVDVSVLPTPDISIRLTGHENAAWSNGWKQSAVYRLSLNNLADYAPLSGWKVVCRLGSQTVTLDKSRPAAEIRGGGLQELIVTASADVTNGIQPASVTRTIPIDTPSYLPDGTVRSLTASYSGSTAADFTVTAALTVRETTMETPPVYRIELLGTVGGQEYVFAHEDVLTSAGSTVTANFRDLPVQYFADTVKNRRVRAWYAASGLGPVSTYGETRQSGDAAVTLRTYSASGEQQPDRTVYSHVLGSPGDFADCIAYTALDITPLAAPVLNEPELSRSASGSISYRFSWTQPGQGAADARYSVRLTGITADRARVGIPLGEVYTDSAAKEFTVSADDWQYAAVELTVTRLGQAYGEAGLSASQTCLVKQRLPRPGQPSVSNPDTNELVYDIRWRASGSETGCAGYRIYVQPKGGQAEPLGALVPAGGGVYSVKRSLEQYAGKTVDLYLVAEADDTGYANSPNGIVYTMTVPERLPAPRVKWTYSWLGKASSDPVAASAFRNGGLTVTVTPQDAASVPPGGSTCLLRAVIYDEAHRELGTYPVSAMRESGGSYVCALSGLDAKYAGRSIRFETRISQSAGQVSSAWVEGDTVTLPRVRLDTPATSLANVNETVRVTYGQANLMIYQADWTALLTTLSWREVENADRYTITLTDQAKQSALVSVDLSGGAPKITVAGQALAAESGGWYNVKPGSTVTGRYSLTGGSIRYYSCQLNTMLRVEDGVFTLKLPNLFSMTTHDNQTLSLSDVQIRQVSVTADSTSTRYAASDAAEREFS